MKAMERRVKSKIKNKKSFMNFRFNRKLGSYIMLTIVAIFTIIPFVWTLSTTLKGPNESLFSMPPQFIPTDITFENFVTVWNTLPIPLYLCNSVIINFFGLLLLILIFTLAGFPLALIKFKGRNLIALIIIRSEE